MSRPPAVEGQVDADARPIPSDTVTPFVLPVGTRAEDPAGPRLHDRGTAPEPPGQAPLVEAVRSRVGGW